MLYIYTPNSLNSNKDTGSRKWFYIGSHLGLEKISRELLSDRRHYIACDIQRITASLRQNFIDFIGKFSQLQPDKLLWYSTCIASKSISQTTIFQQYIYLKLIEEYSNQREDYACVTDDPELLENLRLVNFKSVISPVPHKSAVRNLRIRIKGYLLIARYFSRWIVARILLTGGKKGLSETDYFIFSHIDNRVFERLPQYNDEYFGDLADFLSNKGYIISRIALDLVSIPNLIKLRNNFKYIVCPLVFLSLPKFLKAINSRIEIVFSKDTLSGIDDLDILRILTINEIEKENYSGRFKGYLLLHYSYAGLTGYLSSRAVFLYPFENQPWEKMMNLALKNYKRVGYQHTIIPENWLDYAKSEFENKMPLPQEILTSGEKWSELLLRSYKKQKISEAGSIRLRHIWEEKPKSEDNLEHQGAVVLPIYPEVAIGLQLKLLETAADPYFKNYYFKIKPHPFLPSCALLGEKFKHMKNIEIVDTKIKELLNSVSFVLTSGSTAAFESLSYACKTLYYLPESFSDGSESLIKDFLYLAGESDFKEKLKEMLSSPSKSQGFPKQRFFSQPRDEAFIGF